MEGGNTCGRPDAFMTKETQMQGLKLVKRKDKSKIEAFRPMPRFAGKQRIRRTPYYTQPITELTSGAGRLLTNCAHSSFALCNLGAEDIRRDSDRLATWVAALRAVDNDMMIYNGIDIW